MKQSALLRANKPSKASYNYTLKQINLLEVFLNSYLHLSPLHLDWRSLLEQSMVEGESTDGEVRLSVPPCLNMCEHDSDELHTWTLGHWSFYFGTPVTFLHHLTANSNHDCRLL